MFLVSIVGAAEEKAPVEPKIRRLTVLCNKTVMLLSNASKPARASSSRIRRWRSTFNHPSGLGCKLFLMANDLLGLSYSLRRLREKLQQQRKHLEELDKHITEMEEGSGGEDNQHIREK